MRKPNGVSLLSKQFINKHLNIPAKSILLTLGLFVLHACSALPELPQSHELHGESTAMGSDKTGFNITSDSPPNVEVPATVQYEYAQALALMKSEQYEQAIGILREIAQSNENLSGPYVNLGIIYLKSEKKLKAEQALKRAIAINPQNPAAHNLLGMLQRQNGLFNEAQKSYQKALATYPNYLHAHLNMGILCDLYLHNRECAVRHYETYLQLSDIEDKQVSKWLIDLRNRGESKTR